MAKEKVKPSGREYSERIVKPRSMEEGEVLEGKLLAIQQGGNSKVLLLLCDGGVMERIWSSTVLDNALTQNDIGRFVRIEYVGKTTSKSSGRPVKEYKVGVNER